MKMEKTEKQFPPLGTVTLEAVDTAAAAHYLGRKPQTLRKWHCNGEGPIRPTAVYGRLAWPVSEIRKLLQGVPQ